MSSAETTHPIEWQSDLVSGEVASSDGKEVGLIIYMPHFARPWAATTLTAAQVQNSWHPYRLFPTASAARSFVEKSVKEAGHGE